MFLPPLIEIEADPGSGVRFGLSIHRGQVVALRKAGSPGEWKATPMMPAKLAEHVDIFITQYAPWLDPIGMPTAENNPERPAAPGDGRPAPRTAGVSNGLDSSPTPPSPPATPAPPPSPSPTLREEYTGLQHPDGRPMTPEEVSKLEPELLARLAHALKLDPEVDRDREQLIEDVVAAARERVTPAEPQEEDEPPRAPAKPMSAEPLTESELNDMSWGDLRKVAKKHDVSSKPGRTRVQIVGDLIAKGASRVPTTFGDAI